VPTKQAFAVHLVLLCTSKPLSRENEVEFPIILEEFFGWTIEREWEARQLSWSWKRSIPSAEAIRPCQSGRDAIQASPELSRVDVNEKQNGTYNLNLNQVGARGRV
jgi:hypothetical protein